ncbi:MAG: hypothetical protein AMXMBFR7_46560 [Planctomycetota bacterium]
MHRLEREQLIPRPVAEVFPFFADASNLEALTPPWLHFRIVSPLPIEMKAGAAIEYRLRLLGIPFGWQTRILEWDPPRKFIDVQARGPYRRWIHLHTFEPHPGTDGREWTRMRDAVDYEVGWGPFGALAHPFFVKPSLKRIFDYRRARIEALLAK